MSRYSQTGRKDIATDARRLGPLLAASGSDTYRVRVSTDDTTPNYLENKITSADGSVVLTVLNDGADEDLDLSVAAYVTAVIATHAGNASAHHDPVTEGYGISISGQVVSVDTAVIAEVSDLHNPVTFGSDTNSLFSVGASQVINFDTQAANTVLAGPTSGGAADPTMRLLVDADIPSAIARSNLAYVTIGNTSGLSAERALIAGDGLDLTDGGANSTVTLLVDVTDILGNGLTETSNNIVLGTPGTLTVSTSNGVTASSHTHAITSSNSVTSSTAVVLATDTNGRVRVQSVGVGVAAPGTGQFGVSNVIYINETADTNVTVGLVINQGANDDLVASFKSSDVAHGITSVYETDTYGAFEKYQAATGGLNISGVSEDDVGLVLRGMVTADNVAKNSSAAGAVLIRGVKKSGTGVGDLGSNANVAVFRSAASATKAIIDFEGELHLDATVSENAWDDYDDMAILNGFRATMTPEGHELRRRFGHFMEYARDILEKTGAVTFNEDGHHFIAMKTTLMLTIDAMRQMHERMDGRIAAVEQKLLEA